jgi:hypothetical protein
MGTGYTRKDTANNIADGNVADPDVMDAEFDGIQAAFSSTSGHTHDGTAAEGGAVTVTGPSQEYVSDNTALFPKADDTYDLGKTGSEWKDLYIDGTANIDNLVNDGTATFAGATIADLGTVTTADIDGGTIDDVSVTTQDDKFTLQDNTDNTKQAVFEVSGVTTGTTRTFTFPDLSDTLVTLTATQSLTNKTLVSPTITGGSVSDITDLAVADGGTGASTASSARSNLGVSIGSDVQAWDTQLDDIAALTPTNGNFIVGDGTNWVTESGNTVLSSLGITATATEVNKTDGLTASTAELNKLDGVTVSTAEINYLSGVTSGIQGQLDSKISDVTAGTGLSGGGTSGSITLSGVTQSTSAWEAGTSTTEGIVSPAKVKAAINVGAEVAALSEGAVGTYVFGSSASGTAGFGSTRSGSTIYPYALRGNGSSGNGDYANYYFGGNSGTLSGTWRQMGGYQTYNSTQITLWLRIA